LVPKHLVHTLVRRYGTLTKTLKQLYGSYAWDDQSFDLFDIEKSKAFEISYWKDDGHKQTFLNKVKNQLGITSAESWYRVSLSQLLSCGASRTLQRYWPQMLSLIEPKFPWAWEQFNTFSKSTQQKTLVNKMKDIFPGSNVIEEMDITVRGSGDGFPLSVDVYVPEHNLAVEYQGQQHYEDTFKWHNADKQCILDYEKSQHCADAGVTLAHIPYWWSGDAGSLAATIKQQCPSINVKVPQGEQPLLQSIETKPNKECLMKPSTDVLYANGI